MVTPVNLRGYDLPETMVATLLKIVDARMADAGAGGGPVFRAHASAGTVIAAANTPTKASLQVVDFDTDNCFANSRFTPNKAGYYQINASASRGAPAGSGYFFAQVYKNGVSLVDGNMHSPIVADQIVSKVSDIVFMNGTTDFIELFVYSIVPLTTTFAPAAVYLSGAFLHP